MFLWSKICNIPSVLGRVVLAPPIGAPKTNKVCNLVKASQPSPQSLAVEIRDLEKVVVYLKWGALSRTSYQCCGALV